MTKRIAAGAFAILLSTGMALPSFAASSSTGGSTTNQQTITYKVYTTNGTVLSTSNLSSYLKNSNWSQLVNQLKSGSGQAQVTQPTTTQPAKQTTTTPTTTTTTPTTTTTTPTTTTTTPTTTTTTTTTTQPTTTKPSTTSGQQSTTTTDQSSFAKQVIALVNQERAKQNLKPLTEDTALSNMALVKAKDMSQNNYFDHTSPTYGSPFDMMKKFNISFSYAGENIAKGQKTPQEVMTAWMNSAGHRANILNANYTVIGVAYYNGYWVQEFIGR
ncbi:CAP domain-containing protein [Paenibacillus pinistramenti]|uniref:CAP domain-containing protein n=1 Tax=Paenibacillus pinistramenti TaxID=1768003 RepID=UPI001EF06E20|nr:CAP domain-containing protein [Paenibacillus pinistramenti]